MHLPRIQITCLEQRAGLKGSVDIEKLGERKNEESAKDENSRGQEQEEKKSSQKKTRKAFYSDPNSKRTLILKFAYKYQLTCTVLVELHLKIKRGDRETIHKSANTGDWMKIRREGQRE